MTAHALGDEKKLSIAIPTYNFGKYIAETLDSILPEALNLGVEVLIFDGGSTDETPTIARNFAKQYGNLRYVRAPAKGGIDTDMARCVELSGTHYCWLFSSDDTMINGSIETVLKAIHRWEPDLILCRHKECQVDMTEVKEWPVLSISKNKMFRLDQSKDRELYLSLAQTSEAFFSFMGGLIVNRRTWFQGTLEPAVNGSNWAHVARLWRLTAKEFTLGYLHEPLLNRRGGNDSFSAQGSLQRLSIQIDGLLNIFEELYDSASPEASAVRRILRAEVIPHWSEAVRQDLRQNSATPEEFTRLDEMLSRIKD